MIQVIDRFLSYPDRYRDIALEQEFKSIDVGYGTQFHGIAQIKERDWFVNGLRAMWPVPITINYSFFRLSPTGQKEPAYIHTDSDMGMYTALLYLNPLCPDGEGTKFWRHRVTKKCTEAAPGHPGPIENFEQVRHVDMAFNRAVIFDSRLYHSRAREENFGVDKATGRLVQAVFFSI